MDNSYNKKDNLPRSIFVSQEDPRKDIRINIESVLSDRFMVFLAFLMLPIILLPIFLEFPQEILLFFEICDILIIIIFVTEYLLKLYAAKNRWKHFRNPWHILDLIIITLPFIEIFQLVGLNISSSAPLLLRLLRIPRALAVGGRTMGSRLRSQEEISEEIIAEPEMKVRVIYGNLKNIRDNVRLEEIKEILIDNSQDWIDIYNILEKDIEVISNILNISVLHMQSKLTEEIYPHIDYLGKISMVFLQSTLLQYPEKSNKYLSIPRTGFLIICYGNNLITISKKKLDIFENVIESSKNRFTKEELVVSVLYGIFEYVIKNYRAITTEIETELLKIENIPRNLIPNDYLERTFQFKKELTGLGSNLLHLKEVLNNLVQNRVSLEGFNDNWKNLFHLLYDETIYLNDSVQNAKENLLSIIELHINRTSYEMNKIIKILAVITCLAIIPSMIGGLLGENLLDAPFNFYLWQIVIFVFIGMFFIVYIFVKLGWLKS
jgi:Mg2+ and Co2+ transporter CorA